MSDRPVLKHLPAGDGKAVALGKVALSFKAGATVGSPYTVFEMTMPVGAAQPLHTHPPDETMYVLEGELELVGENGDRRRAGPGSVMHVPSGAAHGFVNVGDTPARMLMVSHVGQEAYFDDLAAAMSGRGDVAEVKSRHGVEMVGPVAARAK
ncbi:MAG TPA: cupin domain-containing protein [Polyangiaceae bacterium]